MRTNKILAVVLAVAMLVSLFSVPAFAEGEATVVEDLGILVGDGEGITAEYLAKTATKLQGAMVALRLVGLEEEALAFEGTETFTDAALAEAYWAPILAYYKANPALGFQGPGDGTFGVLDNLTAQMFNKVLLVILGYEEGVDFTWETVNEFAESIGLTMLAGKDELTNQDIAVALVEALGTETVGGLTLISTLVADGVVSQEDAEAAGFEVEEEALAIVDAYASDTDVMVAVTNIEVPEDATISVKKGSAGLNTEVEVAEDGLSVTFTGYFNYTAGTYTLTINEATATVTIVAPYAVDLQLGADFIYQSSAEDLEVGLLNQYGNPMSLSGVTVSVVNVTDPIADPGPWIDGTTVRVDASAPVATGDELFVFVYDPVSMLSVQGTVVVNADPVLKSLTFGDVTQGDEDADLLYEGSSDNVLAVAAVDQYGNAFKLTNISEIVLIESSTIVSDVNIDGDGNLEFDADTAGVITFTAIIAAEGYITNSAPITVYGTPAIDAVVIVGPEGDGYVGEVLGFEESATDQYGNDFEVSGVTFATSNSSIIDAADFDITDGEVTVIPTGAGTVTVYYYFGGTLVGSFDVLVNPLAVPTTITAITIPDAVQFGTYIEVDEDDVTVVDQYGRADELTGDWSIEITSEGAESFTLIELDYGLYEFDADGEIGSDVFNVYISDDGSRVDGSVLAFMLENVSATAIVTIEIADVPTMYSGDAKGDLMSPGSVEAYDETLTFVGKTAAGATVVLVDDDSDGVPDIIDVITVSSTNLLITGAVLTATGSATETVALKAWRDGEVIAMVDVDIAAADPYAAEMYYDPATIDFEDYEGEEDQGLVIKDQYGRVLDVELVFGYYVETTETETESSETVLVEFDNGYLVMTFTDGDTVTGTFTWTLKDGSLSATLIITDWSELV